MNGQQGFSRRLRTAKRRARLSGRRLSAGEMSGMVRGEAEAASSRLAKAKGLELQEKSITQTGELGRERIASQEQMQTRQLGQQAGQFKATQAQQATQFGQTMEEKGLSREQTATLQTERLAEEKARQAAGFEQQTGMQKTGLEADRLRQAERLTAEKARQEAGITSAEEIAAAGRTSQETMHGAGLESAETMQAGRLTSTEELARLGREQEQTQFESGQGLTREQMAQQGEQFRLAQEQAAREAASGRGLQREHRIIPGACIIITACTSPDCYEVNIAREYRDNILDDITLGGYYALCEMVVPWIDKSRFVKRLFKEFLVDKMIDYFEVALNYKNETEFMTSQPITRAFLGFCHLIGLHVNSEVWIGLHN